MEVEIVEVVAREGSLTRWYESRKEPYGRSTFQAVGPGSAKALG